MVFDSPESARKKPSCWRKANKDKKRRSGLLPLFIKTDMRAAVTMEAAGDRFHRDCHSLRADLGSGFQVDMGLVLDRQ
ncbi:MAG: hypothetical protein BWX80_00540 [Candidatus Hydrogenedentes bacterium ADurb.Bin101]|jgi:hypothetical protein|nr:MAG: hypothetical protein BWX80_00540 [Candidatus Hydrogenedentes bacterium ADurb.Bin101]